MVIFILKSMDYLRKCFISLNLIYLKNNQYYKQQTIQNPEFSTFRSEQDKVDGNFYHID